MQRDAAATNELSYSISRHRSPLSFRERCMLHKPVRRIHDSGIVTRGKRTGLTARNLDPHNTGNLYRIYANAPACLVSCQSFLFYYHMNNRWAQ